MSSEKRAKTNKGDNSHWPVWGDSKGKKAEDNRGGRREEYRNRQWEVAQELFEHCHRLSAGDKGAEHYLGLIERYKLETPLADWTGTLELTEK